METPTHEQTSTSSGDGSNGDPLRGAERPEPAARAETPLEVSHLLAADGSRIPIEREPGEESRERETETRRGLPERSRQLVARLVNTGPSPVAVGAFAAGLVIGAVAGALWARR